MEVSNEKLQVKNLVKEYEGKRVLDSLSFGVREGEFLGVLGPSGCGKTTLLRILIGLEMQTAGEIFLDGKSVGKLPAAKRGMGIVFQNYALFPNMTVLGNVEYALKNRPETRGKSRETAEKTLEQIGMKDQLYKKPHQLSGGQQQRVAIGRALITRPSLILADEPTGNLDTQNSSEVIALLKEASRKYEQTIIMITHNRSIAQTVDRVLQVSDGVLTDFGRCRE